MKTVSGKRDLDEHERDENVIDFVDNHITSKIKDQLKRNWRNNTRYAAGYRHDFLGNHSFGESWKTVSFPATDITRFPVVPSPSATRRTISDGDGREKRSRHVSSATRRTFDRLAFVDGVQKRIVLRDVDEDVFPTRSDGS